MAASHGISSVFKKNLLYKISSFLTLASRFPVKILRKCLNTRNTIILLKRIVFFKEIFIKFRIMQQLKKESVYFPNKNPTGSKVSMKERRKAIRPVKVYELNGHEFVHTFFSQFTFCSFCDDFLWYYYFGQEFI